MQSGIQFEYLRLLQLRLSTINNKELAHELQVEKSTIAKYRSGDRRFGPEVAMRIAKILEINPAMVSADMYASRCGNTALMEEWLEAGGLYRLGLKLDENHYLLK